MPQVGEPRKDVCYKWHRVSRFSLWWNYFNTCVDAGIGGNGKIRLPMNLMVWEYVHV